MNMINLDLQLLVYSYLQFEEILTIFRDDIATRDKIIKLYHKELPDIDDVVDNGYLETVKYLYEKGYKPSIDTIDRASFGGHLNVVKYLFENGYRPSGWSIDIASDNGHLDIVKYYESMMY